MTPVTVMKGDGPVILGQPHGGTYLPPEVEQKLNANGLLLADTDWHIGQLCDGLLEGATVVAANFHRYVIDANRDPSGASLYPGQNTTGLCPFTDFDGVPIYAAGDEPAADEISRRVERWHAPYHAALRAEVERVRQRHGVAVVFDCHSIRSRIPFLFEGTLPDLNIGTNDGETCSTRMERHVTDIAEASGFGSVLNGRFRGGWTTRHYGRPQDNIHAIQMEIAQSAYLAAEHAPWTYDITKAGPLRTTLKQMLAAINAIAMEKARA